MNLWPLISSPVPSCHSSQIFSPLSLVSLSLCPHRHVASLEPIYCPFISHDTLLSSQFKVANLAPSLWESPISSGEEQLDICSDRKWCAPLKALKMPPGYQQKAFSCTRLKNKAALKIFSWSDVRWLLILSPICKCSKIEHLCCMGCHLGNRAIWLIILACIEL